MQTRRSRKRIICTPIGIIHSEHRVPEETPAQPAFARDCSGRVEVFPEYAEGLKDLEGFSHLILLYHFHKAADTKLTVKPCLVDMPKGVFATRHPSRPNHIGLSIVRLTSVEGATLHIEDVDILDGSPLLDIKPYVPQFDQVADARRGWTASVPEEVSRQRGRRGYRPKKPE
ncbi:MAG: tRNA (N6-threonylcarbamoyladenosine(37)-N6)-methyltransferase TrmO [Candidatus Hydrogenedentes bacterium]|nr:tRNA (N6-threonylcarbamoyladenosine(37)-N6)-methyltransferase TrmO [Candidatus Hydrogenedentota bacterium]